MKKILIINSNYYENISIDLIYGMPESNLKSWELNLDLAKMESGRMDWAMSRVILN